MLIMALATSSTSSGRSILQIVVIIAAIVFLSIFLRRRRGAGNKLEIAIYLIGDVRHNLKVLGNFSVTAPVLKKLKTGSWKRNYDRLNFLDEQLQNNIKSAFSLSQEFNDRIDAAKKSKSTSYLLNISTDKLKESLDKSREGLATWIRENYQKEMPARRGIFW